MVRSEEQRPFVWRGILITLPTREEMGRCLHL